MSELFKKFKWMLVLVGSLLLAGGILVFVIALVQPSIISLVLSIVVAICLFIAGAMAMFSSFLTERKLFSNTLAYASLVISLGVVLCISSDLLPYFVILFGGVALIVIGSVALIRAIFALVWKDKTNWAVGLFLAAAIAITLGVLVLVFQGEQIMLTIVYIGLAVALITVGAFQLVAGIKLLNK